MFVLNGKYKYSLCIYGIDIGVRLSWVNTKQGSLFPRPIMALPKVLKWKGGSKILEKMG